MAVPQPRGPSSSRTPAEKMPADVRRRMNAAIAGEAKRQSKQAGNPQSAEQRRRAAAADEAARRPKKQPPTRPTKGKP